MNDSDLLKAYAETQSEDAFAELVRRHLDLVFSAALRQVGGDRHLAQDVAQTVFNDLARKAASLSSRVVLSGWLYTSARFAAAKIVRTEQRRLARERESQLMTPPPDHTDPPDWDRLQTVLDDAMHDLKEADRNAVLLRYFKGCSFEDVGESIGVSADGARMRVDRAVERLRKGLAKRGVVSSAAALALVLTQNSIASAPVGLAATIASGAVAATGAGAAITFIEFMAMTKLKAAAIGVVAVGVTIPLILQHQANQQLQESNRVLAAQRAEAAAELEPLRQEIARLNRAATQNTTANSSNELFQLRAEVARLRDEAKQAGRARAIAAATPGNDPTQQMLRSLGMRAEQLKQRLAQTPEYQIPELALIEEKDWLDAAAYVENLQTDEDYRRALNSLRARGKQKAGGQLQAAMRKFAETNNDAIATDLSQLQPFLEKPLDPSILQRYQIVYSGKLGEAARDQDIITEIGAPVDPEYETRFSFRRNGTTSTSYSLIGEQIEAAAERYAAANEGRLPRTVSHLAGMLSPNIDPQRVEKFLAKIPPNITTLEQFKASQR